MFRRKTDYEKQIDRAKQSLKYGVGVPALLTLLAIEGYQEYGFATAAGIGLLAIALFYFFIIRRGYLKPVTDFVLGRNKG